MDVAICITILQVFDVMGQFVCFPYFLYTRSNDNSVDSLGERAGIQFTAVNCAVSEGRGGRGGGGGRAGRGGNIRLDVLTEVACGKECKMFIESTPFMVVGL